MILKKKKSADDKKHEKLPSMQRVKIGMHQSLIVGNRTRANLCVKLCHVLIAIALVSWYYQVSFE